MARKSRTSAPNSPEPPAKVYKTAIYARLSNEDCRNKESDSIENQVHLVQQHISEYPDLKLCAVFSEI